MLDTIEVSRADLEAYATEKCLYAVLDACGSPEVPAQMSELGSLRAASLFRGKSEVELWAIAPYIVRVDTVLLRWIVRTLWPEPWGVFVVADVALAVLRDHFRQLLVVQAPAPQADLWYFRYYDPRVMARFVRACSPAELSTLFGPATTLAITRAETESATGFRLTRRTPGSHMAAHAELETKLPSEASVSASRVLQLRQPHLDACVVQHRLGSS